MWFRGLSGWRARTRTAAEGTQAGTTPPKDRPAQKPQGTTGRDEERFDHVAAHQSGAGERDSPVRLTEVADGHEWGDEADRPPMPRLAHIAAIEVELLGRGQPGELCVHGLRGGRNIGPAIIRAGVGRHRSRNAEGASRTPSRCQCVASLCHLRKPIGSGGCRFVQHPDEPLLTGEPCRLGRGGPACHPLA